MLRDIMYKNAAQYEIEDDFYISYKEEQIHKSTIVNTGNAKMLYKSGFRELWLLSFKDIDTYWIIEDVKPADPIAYRCYKSPF